MGTEAGHLLARLGVVRFDQGYQRRPRHDSIYFREKLLAFGLLLVDRELVIRDTELPTSHHFSPDLRSRLNCRVGGIFFQSFHNQAGGNLH